MYNICYWKECQKLHLIYGTSTAGFGNSRNCYMSLSWSSLWQDFYSFFYPSSMWGRTAVLGQHSWNEVVTLFLGITLKRHALLGNAWILSIWCHSFVAILIGSQGRYSRSAGATNNISTGRSCGCPKHEFTRWKRNCSIHCRTLCHQKYKEVFFLVTLSLDSMAYTVCFNNDSQPTCEEEFSRIFLRQKQGTLSFFLG